MRPKASARDPDVLVPGAIAVVLLLTGLDAGAADAPADAGHGREIAGKWCANCHVVEPNQRPVPDAIPTLTAIAADHAKTDTWLRAWLSTSHGGMPDLTLSRQEISDLIAYIRTLQTK
jgi:mono/diheme cytochrome c family protein